VGAFDRVRHKPGKRERFEALQPDAIITDMAQLAAASPSR
jgi:hypothetical protein